MSIRSWCNRRPGWTGVVVAYQPGEYQPNALDDVDGNNFQILANAIVYAAGQSSCACDDGDPCTQDTCAEAGCEFLAQPAATCDSTWERASLQVKEKTVGKEQLDVKLAKGPALTQLGWGNPLSSGGTAYAVCIYTDHGVPGRPSLRRVREARHHVDERRCGALSRRRAGALRDRGPEVSLLAARPLAHTAVTGDFTSAPLPE